MNIKLILLILVLFVTFLLLLALTLLHPHPTHNPQTNNGNVTIPVFSPPPTSSPQSTFAPTPSPSVNTGYSTQGLNQNYQRTAASTLPSTDQAVFNKITAPLDGNGNIITTTPTFQMKYVNPPNEFLIEILSNNADQGKQDAVTYLKQQGFSPQGICSLKMVIYLSQEVRNYYQQNNLEFNPVPNGC